VGLAYAVWAGAGVALIAIAGYAFSASRWIYLRSSGSFWIVVGVTVINVFSFSVSHSGG
jgi:small multidrug resistance pump